MDYQRLIAVNLTGTFNGMRERARRVRDGGRIINFSMSIIGNCLSNYAVYVATKAAMEAMPMCFRRNSAPAASP